MTLKDHPAGLEQTSGFKPTGDRFVDSCFSFEMTSEKEERTPSGTDLLKDVPGLIKQKEHKTAWQLLEKAKEAYPDFDFIYIWQAFICQKNGQPEKAGALLTRGLKQARQKHLLCDRMGLLAFETGHMKEAVTWWIRSIVLMQSGEHKLIWEPFLYLAYVARACGSEPLFNQLSEQVARICPQGELTLETKAEQELFEKAEQLPGTSVLKAIETGAAPFKEISGQALSLEEKFQAPDAHGIAARQEASPKKARFLIVMAVIVMTAMMIYLVSSLWDKPDDTLPDAAVTPPKTVSKPEQAPEPVPQPPEINRTVVQENPIPQVKETEDIPAKETPAPHKEKLRRLKVKTKTAHPDILKKSE